MRIPFCIVVGQVSENETERGRCGWWGITPTSAAASRKVQQRVRHAGPAFTGLIKSKKIVWSKIIILLVLVAKVVFLYK